MKISLAMTAFQGKELRRHLHSGDGLEAVALMLCGRHSAAGHHRLTVHEIIPVPHDACQRFVDRVTWPTSLLPGILQKATKKNLAVAKIHSHPSGYSRFSPVDDESDNELFPSIHAWMDNDQPHASLIMLPDGVIFGRAFADADDVVPIDVTVVGDNLEFCRAESPPSELPEFARRHTQAFGRGTFEKMRRLSIAVVGCSGTGSVVIEQLARYGVGKLVLVDPDAIEDKNLNRILNTTAADVGKKKVEVLAEFIAKLGLGTAVEALPVDLSDHDAIAAVAMCDIVIGCMDGVDGRNLLNRIATFYLQPYFDVGVRLDADGRGGVEQICGSVHYIQPGRASLKTRGVYTEAQLRADALRRHDPDGYRDQVDRGYLRGVDEDRPAVMSVNMLFASLLVNELLARIHPYRIDDNSEAAAQTISLTAGFWRRLDDGTPDEALKRYLGRGDMTPILDSPFLDMKKRTRQ